MIGGLSNVVHYSRDVINCRRPRGYLGGIASAKALRPPCRRQHRWRQAADGASAMRKGRGRAKPECDKAGPGRALFFLSMVGTHGGF